MRHSIPGVSIFSGKTVTLRGYAEFEVRKDNASEAQYVLHKYYSIESNWLTARTLIFIFPKH